VTPVGCPIESRDGCQQGFLIIQEVQRSAEDLLNELADLIITAAVAMSAITNGGVDEARSTSNGA
jgi:hypothetical protein